MIGRWHSPIVEGAVATVARRRHKIALDHLTKVKLINIPSATRAREPGSRDVRGGEGAKERVRGGSGAGRRWHEPGGGYLRWCRRFWLRSTVLVGKTSTRCCAETGLRALIVPIRTTLIPLRALAQSAYIYSTCSNRSSNSHRPEYRPYTYVLEYANIYIYIYDSVAGWKWLEPTRPTYRSVAG